MADVASPPRSPPHVRHSTAEDAAAIATLHADSWRRHYRGSYPDNFLDGPVFDNRLSVWTERLAHGADGCVTLVVPGDDPGAVSLERSPADPQALGTPEDQPVGLTGFVHVVFDDDTVWGALVDNLHVRHDLRGSGIGTALLARAAAAVVERRPGTGVFLWVLKNNLAAQAFYRARGARFEGSRIATPPGGGPPLVALRCVWPDPRSLATLGTSEPPANPAMRDRFAGRG
jgi:ribosomal protein S18 acetylase RimI-like enzyme